MRPRILCENKRYARTNWRRIGERERKKKKPNIVCHALARLHPFYETKQAQANPYHYHLSKNADETTTIRLIASDFSFARRERYARGTARCGTAPTTDDDKRMENTKCLFSIQGQVNRKSGCDLIYWRLSLSPSLSLIRSRCGRERRCCNSILPKWMWRALDVSNSRANWRSWAAGGEMSKDPK